jgi:glycerophosphoryl diester phosphodiesterase
MQRAGAKVVGWNTNSVTPELVQAVHARRMRCWVWTVDQPERAKELIDWGVNAIISNHPAVIKPLLASV